MALIARPRLQIAIKELSNKNLAAFIESTLLSEKKFFWSWSRNKEKPAVQTYGKANDKHVLCKSSCRPRVPECPAHITEPGKHSRCLDEGYGKPIKFKKSWFSFKKYPKLVKEKPTNSPSNTCPPSTKLCPRELTFKEYMFGVEFTAASLPAPRSCRRAWKNKQLCNLDDPRLEDPRYQKTKGDVLIYSEPEKKFDTRLPGGPQPVPPPPYKTPSAVLCKRVSDCVALVDCYCACISIPTDDPLKHCEPNPCPVSMEPFKTPFMEMRPHNPKKKLFTCKHGIREEDVVPPPRQGSTSCVHSAFEEQSSFQLTEEHCAFHEILKRRDLLIKKKMAEKADLQKMSKNEKLKKLMFDQEIIKLRNCEKKMPTCCSQARCCPSSYPLSQG